MAKYGIKVKQIKINGRWYKDGDRAYVPTKDGRALRGGASSSRAKAQRRIDIAKKREQKGIK